MVGLDTWELLSKVFLEVVHASLAVGVGWIIWELTRQRR
jgi:hypothetical protein